jgi:hypothetical protein
MEKKEYFTPEDKRRYKHAFHGRRFLYIPKLEISWTDRASWRFVFLRSKVWKQLPLEVYQMIDQKLVKNVYNCSVCGITKDCPFICKGK